MNDRGHVNVAGCLHSGLKRERLNDRFGRIVLKNSLLRWALA